MRAIKLPFQTQSPSQDVELVNDWPDLEPPAAGWVSLRTLASAFNHMDLWVARGVPGLELAYPRVSGCDACAVIEEVGEGVSPAWIGKTVIVNAALDVTRPRSPSEPPASTLAPEYELIGEHHHGMHRERFQAPVSHCVTVDDEIDPTSAAAFGLCALTAYSMMVTKAALRPGQSVLITGIGGGVATSALSIAKHFGCPTAVTSRHQWKLDRAVQLGADCALLDDGSGSWVKQVRTWTDKRGVDLAVDSVGKATHLGCIKSLARGGAYVTPGCTTGPDATTDLARLFWNQLRLLGSTMGSNDEFAEVASLYRAGKVAPVVDVVLPPDECRDAYARLERQDQFGKIVVDWR